MLITIAYVNGRVYTNIYYLSYPGNCGAKCASATRTARGVCHSARCVSQREVCVTVNSAGYCSLGSSVEIFQYCLLSPAILYCLLLPAISILLARLVSTICRRVPGRRVGGIRLVFANNCDQTTNDVTHPEGRYW